MSSAAKAAAASIMNPAEVCREVGSLRLLHSDNIRVGREIKGRGRKLETEVETEMRSWSVSHTVSRIFQWHSEMEAYIDRRLKVTSHSGTHAVHGSGVIFGGKRIFRSDITKIIKEEGMNDSVIGYLSTLS